MTLKNSDIAAQRLHNQHLTRPDFEAPADVVRWFGAVQAQDYLGSLYAVGLRMSDGSEAAVEEAITRKTIVRTWPMRGTIHYVPAEDTRWMLKTLARRQVGRLIPYLRRAGLTDDVLKRAGKVLAKELKGGRLMRSEIYKALEAAGIETTGEQRGLHILAYWAHEGLICFGPRRGKQATFTLLDEWIPAGRSLSGDEALAELARRYFTGHGPATLRDFTWWSGLPAGEAARALQAVAPQLRSQTVGRQTYWTGAASDAKRPRPPDVHLLPPFDEFTVGYTDRSALLDPKVAAGVSHGLAPSIIVNGRMVGTWKRTRYDGSVSIELNLLEKLSAMQYAALKKAVRRYGAFVGLPAKIER